MSEARRGQRGKERGSAVIEFAGVFLMFFLVMYGIVAYGIIFAIRHSLTQAVNEGARAAVADVGGLDVRKKLAEDTAATAIAWLGTRAPVPVVTSAPCAATPFLCLKVTLAYDYAVNPIIPALPVLPLPASITAEATVELDAVNFF
ncbi:MAG: TadE/TadG family type IV pilus assembly protein [Bacteroidota bacterium]